jgi:hypothetical protein
MAVMRLRMVELTTGIQNVRGNIAAGTTLTDEKRC